MVVRLCHRGQDLSHISTHFGMPTKDVFEGVGIQLDRDAIRVGCLPDVPAPHTGGR
jgi:hypothetical protein